MMNNLEELLRLTTEKGASDLHLTAGSPPKLRINGELVPLESPPLTPEDTKRLCYSILNEEQKNRFEKEKEIDLSFSRKGLSRFRANIFVQRGAVAGAFRSIPFKIPSFQELGLPSIVEELIKKPRGLVLVTGATGCGKSTTLAALIDRINSERKEHIITIEDPIEYLHFPKNCIVNQREVGADTKSFKTALKYILRQDPDVILIGEMRDLETIESALVIAETGHLVFATLHTNSSIQTVNRVIDVFSPHQQSQVRAQLSFVLEGILSQQLIPRRNGEGRCLALEILIPNLAIRNLIREGKTHQIYSIMQVDQSRTEMQTMNQSLLSLYQKGLVSYEEAFAYAFDPEELKQMMENVLKNRIKG